MDPTSRKNSIEKRFLCSPRSDVILFWKVSVFFSLFFFLQLVYNRTTGRGLSRNIFLLKSRNSIQNYNNDLRLDARQTSLFVLLQQHRSRAFLLLVRLLRAPRFLSRPLLQRSYDNFINTCFLLFIASRIGGAVKYSFFSQRTKFSYKETVQGSTNS